MKYTGIKKKKVGGNCSTAGGSHRHREELWTKEGEQGAQGTHWRRPSPWGLRKHTMGTREGLCPSLSHLGPSPAHPGSAPERQSQAETDTCTTERRRWMKSCGAYGDKRETDRQTADRWTDRQEASRSTQTEQVILDPLDPTR